MEEEKIILICRHSERIDFSKERSNQRLKKGDPELTENGIQLAKTLGQKIAQEFKYYIDNNKISLYVSPFTRTLETAIILRNEMQNNLKKVNQQLIIIQDLGECNIYEYNLYPNILYLNKDEDEKQKELYNELIINKINQGNINYEINYIKNNKDEIKHPETLKESDERYIKIFKKILDNELMNDKNDSNLIIIVTHGEGVSSCCKYLCNIIKKKSGNENKKLWPDFLNNIQGNNQKYCNSFCFKMNKNEENISYYDEICYKPEYEINSNILLFENYYKNILINWLKNPKNDKNENKKLNNIKLIYRGSRDGFQAKIFHEKCDNKGETLIIIESKDNYIFGGYTEINWDSTIWNKIIGEKNNTIRKGNGNEFIFTLKNPYLIKPSKYNIKKKYLNNSICCDSNLGPIFGCNDIRIEDNCNINENKFTYYDYIKDECGFIDNTGKKRLLFTGKNSFLVKEIEVFNIIR